jgi:hypothetical protein
MNEDDIYQIFMDMVEERKVAGLRPWEPPRMDFAMKVAEFAYEKGYNDGWDRENYSGLVGDPQ